MPFGCRPAKAMAPARPPRRCDRRDLYDWPRHRGVFVRTTKHPQWSAGRAFQSTRGVSAVARPLRRGHGGSTGRIELQFVEPVRSLGNPFSAQEQHGPDEFRFGLQAIHRGLHAGKSCLTRASSMPWLPRGAQVSNGDYQCVWHRSNPRKKGLDARQSAPRVFSERWSKGLSRC
jgi:hypothetical protein